MLISDDLFSSFSQPNSTKNNTIVDYVKGKSTDSVLGIQIQDSWIKGTNESTEP